MRAFQTVPGTLWLNTETKSIWSHAFRLRRGGKCKTCGLLQVPVNFLSIKYNILSALYQLTLKVLIKGLILVCFAYLKSEVFQKGIDEVLKAILK